MDRDAQTHGDWDQEAYWRQSVEGPGAEPATAAARNAPGAMDSSGPYPSRRRRMQVRPAGPPGAENTGGTSRRKVVIAAAITVIVTAIVGGPFVLGAGRQSSRQPAVAAPTLAASPVTTSPELPGAPLPTSDLPTQAPAEDVPALPLIPDVPTRNATVAPTRNVPAAPGSPVASSASPVFKLVSLASGKPFGVGGEVGSDGSPIVEVSNGPSKAQLWRIVGSSGRVRQSGQRQEWQGPGQPRRFIGQRDPDPAIDTFC